MPLFVKKSPASVDIERLDGCLEGQHHDPIPKLQSFFVLIDFLMIPFTSLRLPAPCYHSRLPPLGVVCLKVSSFGNSPKQLGRKLKL